MKQEQTHESFLQERLTQTEHEVFALVVERGSIPVDDLEARSYEVRNLIGMRRLGLVVVQRDWGTEFNIQQSRTAPQSEKPEGL